MSHCSSILTFVENPDDHDWLGTQYKVYDGTVYIGSYTINSPRCHAQGIDSRNRYFISAEECRQYFVENRLHFLEIGKQSLVSHLA